MTVLELNSLPYLSANLDRILQYLEADTTVPAWFIPMNADTDPIREVLQGELPALMAEYRRLTEYINDITDHQMKHIFELRFVEQTPMREIGQILGATSSETKHLIYSYLNRHPEGYLSTRQAAELWNVSIDSVNSWCRKGLIPGAKKRGQERWIIPRAAERPQFNRHK